MNEVNHRQQTLTRALAAFDQSRARRRFLRRAGSATAALALLVTAGVVAWPREHRSDIVRIGSPVPAPTRSNYPACVEILQSDQELMEALNASGACEGFGRDGNRVFIVECSASGRLPPA